MIPELPSIKEESNHNPALPNIYDNSQRIIAQRIFNLLESIWWNISTLEGLEWDLSIRKENFQQATNMVFAIVSKITDDLFNKYEITIWDISDFTNDVFCFDPDTKRIGVSLDELQKLGSDLSLLIIISHEFWHAILNRFRETMNLRVDKVGAERFCDIYAWYCLQKYFQDFADLDNADIQNSMKLMKYSWDISEFRSIINFLVLGAKHLTNIHGTGKERVERFLQWATYGEKWVTKALWNYINSVRNN